MVSLKVHFVDNIGPLCSRVRPVKAMTTDIKKVTCRRCLVIYGIYRGLKLAKEESV